MTPEDISQLRPRIRRARRTAEILCAQHPCRDNEELVEVLEECQRLADLPMLTDRIDARRRR